jgi:hypothetical protein
MPEGQFTGNRNIYVYRSESGSSYLLQLDETLGDIQGCGLTKANTNSAGSPAPKRFKPRGVYWQGKLGDKIKRKFLVCAPNSVLYQADRSQKLTIDGVDGSTTGRIGEKLSYLSLDEAPAEPV